MTEQHLKNIYFFTLTCILFFCDILFFGLLNSNKIYSLLCLFIIIISKPHQHRTLLMPILLLSILSYLQVNIFGFAIIYLMPTMLIGYFLDQHLQAKFIIPYFLLMYALNLQRVINFYLQSIKTSYLFLSTTILYNICLIFMLIMITDYFEKKLEKMRNNHVM
ncbi:MAG: hypothetical protein ACXWL5_03310 [Candidatus Chromulinivorax sp.]